MNSIRLLECGCCGQYHPEGSFLPGGSANYKMTRIGSTLMRISPPALAMARRAIRL